MPTTDVKSAWELLWYGGIALSLLGVLYTIMAGHLITKGHHAGVVAELQRVITLLSEDRDEWRTHAGELRGAIDRLVEAAQLKRRS